MGVFDVVFAGNPCDSTRWRWSVSKKQPEAVPSTGGRLKSSYEPVPPDRMFTVLHIEEDSKGAAIPVGSSGWIAIRGEDWKAVVIIRQILMRWYTWSNYVFKGD